MQVPEEFLQFVLEGDLVSARAAVVVMTPDELIKVRKAAQLALELTGGCLCDARYEGCKHGTPCGEAAGGHRSPYFCTDCDPRRIQHISASLEELVGRSTGPQ